MSERGNFRGRGGGARGGNSNRGAGGNRGGSAQGGDKPKKENILDLNKYMDKEITVKFNGGREGVCVCVWVDGGICLVTVGRKANFGICREIVTGTLKGYDQLMNLVLDDVKELLRGMVVASVCFFLGVCQLIHSLDDEGNESTRSLGLIVARGTLLVLISPLDGSEQIANPFNNQEED